MKDFQMKVKRFIRSFHIGSLGAFASGLLVLATLLQLGILASAGVGSEGITELIFAAINCMFYLMITRNFLRAKQENKLSLINYNLLILTIFDYIIPAINVILQGAFNGDLLTGLFATLLPNSLLGILYFVFLTRENKSKGKNNLVFLTIIGGLMLLISCVSIGFTITISIESMVASKMDLTSILLLVYEIMSGFITFIFGIIYFTYPMFIKRERTKGF